MLKRFPPFDFTRDKLRNAKTIIRKKTHFSPKSTTIQCSSLCVHTFSKIIQSRAVTFFSKKLKSYDSSLTV